MRLSTFIFIHGLEKEKFRMKLCFINNGGDCLILEFFRLNFNRFMQLTTNNHHPDILPETTYLS